MEGETRAPHPFVGPLPSTAIGDFARGSRGYRLQNTGATAATAVLNRFNSRTRTMVHYEAFAPCECFWPGLSMDRLCSDFPHSLQSTNKYFPFVQWVAQESETMGGRKRLQPRPELKQSLPCRLVRTFFCLFSFASSPLTAFVVFLRTHGRIAWPTVLTIRQRRSIRCPPSCGVAANQTPATEPGLPPPKP